MARDSYDRDPTFKPKAFTEPPCQAQVDAPPAALKKDPAKKGRPPCQPTKSQLLKEPPTDHERDMGRQSERALDPGLQKSGGWTMSSDRLPGKLVHHVFDYATISTRRVPEFVGGSVCCVNRNGTFRQSTLTNRSMVEAQNDKITQPCAVMRVWEPNETVAQITQHGTPSVVLDTVITNGAVTTQQATTSFLKSPGRGPAVPHGSPDSGNDPRRSAPRKIFEHSGAPRGCGEFDSGEAPTLEFNPDPANIVRQVHPGYRFPRTFLEFLPNFAHTGIPISWINIIPTSLVEQSVAIQTARVEVARIFVQCGNRPSLIPFIPLHDPGEMLSVGNGILELRKAGVNSKPPVGPVFPQLYTLLCGSTHMRQTGEVPGLAKIICHIEHVIFNTPIAWTRYQFPQSACLCLERNGWRFAELPNIRQNGQNICGVGKGGVRVVFSCMSQKTESLFLVGTSAEATAKSPLRVFETSMDNP